VSDVQVSDLFAGLWQCCADLRTWPAKCWPCPVRRWPRWRHVRNAPTPT